MTSYIYQHLARPLWLTLAVATLSIHLNVSAQSTVPPTSVDLATVLRLAREVSPRLAIERLNISGAEANRITAGAYPNPTLSFGRSKTQSGQATMFTGKHQDQMNLELPVMLSGQRSARIDKAEREIEAARARVRAGTSTFSAEVASALYRLQAAQETVALLTKTRSELQRLRDIIAGRADSGMASRFDVLRLDVELGTNQSKLGEAQAEVSDCAGQLAALLGIPQWQPVATNPLAVITMTATQLDNPQQRRTHSPILLSAQSEERVAASAVEVARRERWPVPSLNVGRAQTADPFGAVGYLGVSVELPLFDTRRGPLAKAESEARAATLKSELTESETAAQLLRYAQIIRTRQSALTRYEEDTAARLPTLQQMAEDAYRLGRGTVFDLVDATRTRHELQQNRIDLLAALIDAQLHWLALTGELERLHPSTPTTPP